MGIMGISDGEGQRPTGAKLPSMMLSTVQWDTAGCTLLLTRRLITIIDITTSLGIICISRDSALFL